MSASAERAIVFVLFGIALALFAWRFQASGSAPPAGANVLDKGALPDVEAPPAVDPALLVGMSTLPGDGPSAGPWWYTANVPDRRPPMPAAPSAVSG